jgi:hypothetical protein
MFADLFRQNASSSQSPSLSNTTEQKITNTNEIDNLILNCRKETDNRFIHMFLEQTKPPLLEDAVTPSIIHSTALKEFKTTITNVCKIQNFPTREEFFNIIESALFLVFSKVSNEEHRLILVNFLKNSVGNIDSWQRSRGFSGTALISEIDAMIIRATEKANKLRLYSQPTQNTSRDVTQLLLSLFGGG